MSMHIADKRTRKLVKALVEDQGCTYRQAGDAHILIKVPNGGTVTLSTSRRGGKDNVKYQRMLNHLRSAGVDTKSL